jgi:hypothetical protein
VCDVAKCKRPSILGYSAFGPGRNKDVSICDHHWEKHCDDNDKFDLKTYFYPTRVAKKKK